ncbi:NAD(P)H-quinone oxidoreductase subunit H chloroplastic [Bienertia sinuspersici]
MFEFVKIIQQALEGIPRGPYENLEIRSFNRIKYPEWNDFEYRFMNLCKSRSPKGRFRNLFNRRSECFSLEMENSPTRLYQFENSSSGS